MKKLLAILTCVLLLCASIPLGALSVSAETYGALTYTVSGGEVTITGYTADLPADLVIPDTIEGYPVTTIGDYAFSYCSAFYYQRSLTSVIIPDSVTTIGDYAFSHCASLTSVTIGDSVTTIGKDAFYDCRSLTSVIIPDSVRTIEGGAFWDCYSLTSVTIGDSVTYIGQGAFCDCNSLTSVTIPDSVTYIGPVAFASCASLTSIQVDENNPNYCDIDGVLFNKSKTTLIQYPGGRPGAYYAVPDNVTTIGIDAFSNCASLESVTIPDSVSTIGISAFYNCTSLTSVTMGDSVTTILWDAFFSCTSLTDVYYNGTEADRANIAIDSNNTKLTNATWHYNDTPPATGLTYEIVDGEVTITGYTADHPADLVIPDTIEGYPVTTIGEYAFYECYSLTSVTIPDSVTTIGYGAFYGCSSLTSVTIPDSVTTIGERAFRYCTSLTSVTIGDSVTTIGKDAFHGCKSLTSVTIGDSVTTIGNYAFDSCSSLTSVTIPDSVTTIGDRAFSYCDSLTSVTIGDSVTTIGNSAFYDCYSLTSVTIPDSVTSIGEDAFYGCASLTSVTIGDSVTTIEDSAFYWCSSLTDVYYNGTEADRANIAIGSNNTALTNATWHYNDTPPATGLTYEIVDGEVTITGYTADLPADLVIPDTIEGYPVTTIGGSAFHSCTSLTSVTIPDSVITIWMWAFYSCDSLTSVTIGDRVTTIGDRAFDFCDSLTSIQVDENNPNYCDIDGVLCNKSKTTLVQYPGGRPGAYAIPDSVTTIGEKAFYSCDSLTSVTIGNSVTTIGESAFSSCDSLTSVTIGDSVTTIGKYAFNECNSLESVTIGDSVTTIGVEAFSDCTSLTSVTIGDSVTTIKDSAFYSCDSLTSVTIPDSVTTIGEKAFYSCDSLTSVTIGDSVTTIGKAAFRECNSLTSVTIGDSVTTIGSYAFYYCTSLTSVTIPDSVTTIGEWAFYYCRSLTSVTIPDSVTSIESYAFENCPSLTDVYYSGTEEDRANIAIASTNTALTKATWHYNYIPCNHVYVGAVTTPNNCGNTGVMTYTCTACGDTYTEVLPTIGKHVYDNGFDTDCDVCGYVREMEVPADAPAFVMEDATVRVGDTFTVAIRTLNNSGIVSLKLQVSYDTDLLELVSVAQGDFSGLSFGPLANTPFIVNWVDALRPNNTTNGNVVFLTFRVKDNATAGETAITVSYNPNDVYDYDFNNVAFLVENSTVNIVDSLPGDVNGDNEVNNKDLGLLQRYLNEWKVSVDTFAADTDGNGRINNQDLGLLQRYLNGWDIELG